MIKRLPPISFDVGLLFGGLILGAAIGWIVTSKLTSDPSAAGVTLTCVGRAASDFDCHSARYKALVERQGTDAAIRELKAKYQNDPFTQSQCHQLTHVVGRTAAAQTGDLVAAFNQGDSFCWSGYYHGVTETIVARVGLKRMVAEVNNICTAVSTERRYSFYHYNCVHGLGHGFMAMLGDEVFESLEICDRLTDGWERESCFGGVFMENIMADINDYHDTKYLRPAEPMYPCTDVASRQKTQCYLMQTSYALKVSNYDFGSVFQLCGEVETDWRAACYQSLGRDASGNSISDLAKTRQTCLLGPDQDSQLNCLTGAVKDFISYHHSDQQALELCRSFEAALSNPCLDTARSYYATFK